MVVEKISRFGTVLFFFGSVGPFIDYPVGSLSVVDLNGDKLADVIMTTNGGRVIAIDVADGKIRWSTEMGYVSTPAFADLDADAR